MNRIALCAIVVVLKGLRPGGAAAGAPDAAAPLDRAMAAAETSLREGELQAAESHYRTALLEGWLLMGTLARVEGRPADARDTFRRASASAVENRFALQALALAELELGEAAQAVQILTRLERRDPKDVLTRRLRAQALAVSGRLEESVRELEETRALAPDDLELSFALAGAYLGLRKPDAAARLFAQIVAARPGPRTHVLIGRTYRDFGEYERARAELRTALKLDPRVRRAHYYLGNMIVAEKRRAGLEEAVPEFQAELEVAPQDPLASLELGTALVDLQRPEEALPHLEVAARAEPAQAQSLYYLGRCQVGLNRPAEGADSLRRALQLAEAQGANSEALKMIRLQLGQALQRLGETDEAAVHFAEAQRLSVQGTEAERERFARHLADAPGPEAATSAAPMIESSPLAELPASDRRELTQRVRAALVRAYLNLGVMQARRQSFARAVEHFEQAAELDPDFPQVQSSLGVAYFNARQFDKATVPLSRALAASPQDAGLKRTLGMAWLNAQEYRKAAELLRGDAELDSNPSLQFAYGLALVKSDQAAAAERVFSQLLARHGDSAELSVLLGQAHAQLGDFDAAIESFQRALRLKADVVGAGAGLGVIYLRQGRMAEAEQSLRAELAGHPTDLQSQQNLAVVLESEQRPDEAVPLLRSVLQSKPDFADARYLLGKILFAQGATAEAVEHLEAAARLAPEDANTHYQLGRAYTTLGRTDEAEKQFEILRQIKAKR